MGEVYAFYQKSRGQRAGQQLLKRTRTPKAEDLMLRNYPWTVKGTLIPSEYWDNKKNVTRAVDWLLKKTRKKARSLSTQDFMDNHLYCLLHSRDANIYAVLKDASRADFFLWEVDTPHQPFWSDPDNRIQAIKWLDNKLKKEHVRMTPKEFKCNRMGSLIEYYHNDVNKAREEARLPLIANIQRYRDFIIYTVKKLDIDRLSRNYP